MFPHRNSHKMGLEVSSWGNPQSDWPYSDRKAKAFKYAWCPIIQGSRLWYGPLSDVGKDRERLAVNKQESNKFHIERFNKQTKIKTKTNSMAFNPQANYTDWATATGRRILMPTFVERGEMWSMRRIPHGRWFQFSRPELLFLLSSSSSVTLTRLSGPCSRPTATQKICSAGNWTRDLWDCSQELWILDHTVKKLN
jgi:hypothetical protein